MRNHVVIVTTENPWTTTSGGTARTRAIAAALEALGHRVTVVHPDATTAPASSWRVRVAQRARAAKRAFLPLPTIAGARSASMAQAVAACAHSADVLLATTLSTAQYAKHLDHAVVWMDYSDVWSDFARREASHRHGLLRISAGAQARHLRRIETRVNAQAELVTAAGWADRLALSERGCDATWLPTPIPRSQSITPAFTGGRRVAGFIGNFGFGPNRDALQLLLTTWGPALRDRGWALVVGGLLSDTLDLPSWVASLGPLDDVGQFYESIDVALAPIRLGGGMKVKVVEALIYGRPVLATDFAMEGFPPALKEMVTVVDATRPTMPSSDNPPRPPDPADPRLSVFSELGLLATVRTVLDGRRVVGAGRPPEM